MKKIDEWIHNYQNLSFEQQYEVAKKIVENIGNKQHHFMEKKKELIEVVNFFNRIIDSAEQKQIIEGKIDNKASYALERCIEEMYKDEPYGLYKYGYIEDLEKIDAQNLYEYYLEMIKNVKIDIFVSGNLDDKIINELKESKIIEDLKERNANFNINKENEIKPQVEEPKTITESMQINQGKLIIGLDVLDNRKESKYATSVYNVILGGSANSKMFQNVREKASLAYTAGSNYLRQKDNVFVKCGIDIPNFDKALEIIKEQLKQMEDGDFTEEDIENAKTIIDASVGSITESQDSEITYYFSQELSDEVVSIEEYIKKINEVTKEQIVEIAKKIQINTIYFLKD